MDQFLRVGVISNTHGIRGEVKVFPTTEDVKRFESLKEVVLDTKKNYITLKIKSVKYFKQFVILKFEGIDNINDIEPYKGMDLLVSRENAIKLEENEYFIYDLIGCTVYSDEDKELGTLTEVLQTGANDVYVVKTSHGKEILFPAIPECVLDVDIEEKKVIVHIMDGLLD